MSDQAMAEESFGLMGDEASRAAAQQQQLKLGSVTQSQQPLALCKHFRPRRCFDTVGRLTGRASLTIKILRQNNNRNSSSSSSSSVIFLMRS